MSLNNEVLVFVSIGHGFEERSARRNADRFPSAVLSSACKGSFERTLPVPSAPREKWENAIFIPSVLGNVWAHANSIL